MKAFQEKSICLINGRFRLHTLALTIVPFLVVYIFILPFSVSFYHFLFRFHPSQSFRLPTRKARMVRKAVRIYIKMYQNIICISFLLQIPSLKFLS